ncbi:MAG: MBL fold metallo-hydrolase [Euryarchaeota archaeon]|jgi:7,8-dihydropterin-6-yl-methyl-4-(beta-D-ribofuranosyl)aminobenzene 5'-phosphate synthase|nr:MBL fold metallo-hydrolase [Euryarchaeota archaeon]
MEIVCLIDNHLEDSRLASEHGLSVYIDQGKEKILFDTGATGKAVENAMTMDVELEKVELAIISHGHYDHGGGLEAFLEVNRKAQVYMCQGAAKKHFRIDNDVVKDIGLDESVLKKYSERITYLDEFIQLRDDLFLITSIRQVHAVPEGNKFLYEEEGLELVQDSFTHELVMVLKREDGLVVLTGCSHNGILNILDAVVEKFPETPLIAVFGGLHLMIPPDDSVVDPRELDIMARKLMEYPIGRIYTGHCTGIRSYQFLKRIMGDRINYFATGSRVTI